MGSDERHQACPGGRSIISQVGGEALLREKAGQGHSHCWAFVVTRVVETSGVRGWSSRHLGKGQLQTGLSVALRWRRCLVRWALLSPRQAWAFCVTCLSGELRQDFPVGRNSAAPHLAFPWPWVNLHVGLLVTPCY